MAIDDFIYQLQTRFADEAGTEYIYKEPKVTSLAEIAERLNKMYCAKFGAERVKLAMDSNPVCWMQNGYRLPDSL